MDVPTQGNPSPKEGQGESAPSVTLEQVAEIVNKAISARNTAFETKFSKLFQETVGSLSSSFEEKIAALKPAEKPAEKGAESAELNGLRKQLESLTKAQAEATAREHTAVAKQRDMTLRAQVADRLSSLGIPQDRHGLALSHLVDGQKRVRFADDGETIVFGLDDGTVVPLDQGFKDHWAKSPEAKLLIPARGTAGSGARPGGSAGNTEKANPHQQVGEALFSMFQRDQF